jgi:hypothetical protein
VIFRAIQDEPQEGPLHIRHQLPKARERGQRRRRSRGGGANGRATTGAGEGADAQEGEHAGAQESGDETAKEQREQPPCREALRAPPAPVSYAVRAHC